MTRGVNRRCVTAGHICVTTPFATPFVRLPSRQVAHDACDDAKMTMELFNHWRRGGMGPIRLPLQWHYVHWQQMAPELYAA